MHGFALKFCRAKTDKQKRSTIMNKPSKPANAVRYLKFRVVDEGFIVPIGKNKKTYSLSLMPVTKSVSNDQKQHPQRRDPR
jgi:hypothetical protein